MRWRAAAPARGIPAGKQPRATAGCSANPAAAAKRENNGFEGRFVGTNRTFVGTNRTFVGTNRTFVGSNRTFVGSNRTFVGTNRTLFGSNRTFVGTDRTYPAPAQLIVSERITGAPRLFGKNLGEPVPPNPR
jgi:hypothetical protein